MGTNNGGLKSVDDRLISGLVGGGRVSGSGVGLLIVSLGVTVVGDISDVSRVAVDVIVDVLLATVGEDDPVVSLGVVTIATFVLAHVDVGVVVVDGPVEFVVGGGLYKNKSNEILHNFYIFKKSSELTEYSCL